MTNVQILLNRVVEGLKEKGYKPYWINYIHTPDENNIFPRTTIDVKETVRMNHNNLENVTVTIGITRWRRTEYGGHRGIKGETVKVPANASEKVLKNRINKVIEAYQRLDAIEE